ncbi:MAG: dienelactone hydrolase family protein [Proteobacteria bacterium]|nr:dienelactone hydrolase family protein [Pseudomonadota bacterium]
MTLKTEKRAAKSGHADSLVVFIHGYGADGNDLIGLADPMAEHLPNTAFMSPHAPDACSVNPMGREWFPIPMMDNSTQEVARAGMLKSAELFQGWLDGQISKTGLTSDRVVLVGFSQGTMLALHTAPRRAAQLAGIVGFSGRLLAPELLKEQAISKPPVLLVHGDMDMVVPPTDMAHAADALVSNGFDVFTHVSKGTAHGIAPDGLGLAVQFIQTHLGNKAATAS